MNVLIGGETSGEIREAFRRRGHDAYSCDLLPADTASRYHIQRDMREALNDNAWDLFIVHPTCTYLCNSSVWCLHRDITRWPKMVEAAVFFRDMLNVDVPHVAAENPVMHGYALTIIGQRASQFIQPWQFGEDASKATGLWLKNLPLLKPTNIIKKHRYANQTPSGQNKESPGPDRWKIRSRTYHGIAEAMAEQWGNIEAITKRAP